MGKRIDDTVCHCLKMRRSSENVIKFYDNFLAPAGVTARQESLLCMIRQHSGCSVKELSVQTQLERSTLARSLKPLINVGYVNDSKEKGTRDSKLELTELGKKVCGNAEVLWLKAQEEYENKVGKDQIVILENLLEKLEGL